MQFKVEMIKRKESGYLGKCLFFSIPTGEEQCFLVSPLFERRHK